jgi:hypothetical protein
MVGMAGMAVIPAVERSRVQQASTLLSDALRKSQIKAVSEGRMRRVILDGNGIREEYATSPAAALDCSLTGWQQAPEPSMLPAGVSVSLSSRACINFAPSGRTVVPMPFVDVSLTPYPLNFGSVLRLVDGYRVDDQQVNDLSFNPYDPSAPTAVWADNSVSITLDGQESRYYTTVCIGLISAPDLTVGYPASIQVEGSLDSINWTTFYNRPGPLDPGGRAQTCVPVDINQQLRYFRVTLARNAMDLALDEIDFGDLFFRVSGKGGSKDVLISPVTGKVSVKSN